MDVNGLYLLVGGFKHVFFYFPFHKKRMSSFPLTFTPSFFKMVIAPPTSLGFLMRYNPVTNHESLIFFPFYRRRRADPNQRGVGD
jgi:hypothetical protein